MYVRTMAAPRFPHTYSVRVSGRDLGRSTIDVESGGAPPMMAGPPPQFGGTDDWWSPEQLLVAALGTCTMTTFLALARHAKVAVDALGCDVDAELDKTSEGIRFTSASVRITVKAGSAECDAIERLVEKTHRHCIITHSLAFPVEVTATVSCADGNVRTVAA